jgi:hypothetical protein
VDIKPILEYQVTNKIRLFPVVWKQLIMNAAVYLQNGKFCVKSSNFGTKVVKIQATIGNQTISFRGSVVSQPEIICTIADFAIADGSSVKLFIDDQEVRNAKVQVLDIENLQWPFWAVFGGVLVLFYAVLAIFMKKKLL